MGKLLKMSAVPAGIREAALRIGDAAVADHPDVVASRARLAAASARYADELEPRQSTLAAVHALQAEREQAERQIEAALAQREALAVAIADAESPPQAYDELLATVNAARRCIERTPLALPTIEQRARAVADLLGRAAELESDAQRAASHHSLGEDPTRSGRRRMVAPVTTSVVASRKQRPPFDHRTFREAIVAGGRWTPELRAKQAAAIHRWRPWSRSTGPRTADGKAVAAANGPRHPVRVRQGTESEGGR